jgi:DNA-binding response OmpR family regulator
VETNKTILIVEDEPRDEILILRVFKKYNISNQVVIAHDGVEALDYLFGTGMYATRNPCEAPELILLDLKLPRVDGLEVLRRVRLDERVQLVPVVILTSSDEDRDRIAGYQLGVNSYVKKPIEFGEFSEAVRQLGIYWMLLNRPPPLLRSGHGS